MRKIIPATYHHLLTVILLWSAMPVLGQSWLDYDQALSRYPWLSTTNAAALTTYSPEDSTQNLLGDACLTVSTGQGHLERLNASPHAWTTQARVQSIYRIGHRVVLHGGMDYRYSWGSQAGGSVWLVPERMPFDITEVADSTRGNISHETYNLNGGAGVDIGKGISLGASVYYTTASGAKKKDPRHTNSLMDSRASIGILWHCSGFTLGANYMFGRRTEALKFSTVGSTDQVYHYLINHGAYYGRDELTDGNGYVGSTHEKPLLDIGHGAAVQAGYHHDSWDWGIEGRWMHRHGHYGLESPSMVDFNRHHGDEWHLQSWLQHDAGTTIKRITIQYAHQGTKDYERTYRTITTQGVTDIDYYDDRLMGDIGNTVIGVTGDARWGIRRQLATWQTVVSLKHSRRSVTASIYPFYRQQATHLTRVALHGTRTWLTGADHALLLTLQAGWASGGGTASHDGVYQTPSADAEVPQQQHLLMMREFEYLTANRLHAGLSLRWSFPTARHCMRLYLDGGYQYSQAFDIHYLENGYRHKVAMSIGCLF